MGKKKIDWEKIKLYQRIRHLEAMEALYSGDYTTAFELAFLPDPKVIEELAY